MPTSRCALGLDGTSDALTTAISVSISHPISDTVFRAFSLNPWSLPPLAPPALAPVATPTLHRPNLSPVTSPSSPPPPYTPETSSRSSNPYGKPGRKRNRKKFAQRTPADVERQKRRRKNLSSLSEIGTYYLGKRGRPSSLTIYT
ncbi:hypothetical protein A4X13_0g7908 [Tilletia indica]|uniref:Uncharacterized protein n=1 Tax=Tilletia indica TaxID=43049 RepID=A0A177TET4_9BASI|nr:hypothetical protein A4X13_0g7908 [Tilletia indica]